MINVPAINDSVRSIIGNLDKGDYVCSVFVNLSKAFNTVDHQILLNRVYEIGIRRLPLVLPRTSLRNRFIRTRVNGFFSDERAITVEVRNRIGSWS